MTKETVIDLAIGLPIAAIVAFIIGVKILFC